MSMTRRDEAVTLTLTREEANAVLVALFLGSSQEPDPAVESVKEKLTNELAGWTP